jgi:hypothetical protein
MSVNSNAVCLTQMRSTGDECVTGSSAGSLFGYPTSPISASPVLRQSRERISIANEDPFFERMVLHTLSTKMVERASPDLTPPSREVTWQVSRDVRSSESFGRSAGIWRLVTFEGESGSDVVDRGVIS